MEWNEMEWKKERETKRKKGEKRIGIPRKGGRQRKAEGRTWGKEEEGQGPKKESDPAAHFVFVFLRVAGGRSEEERSEEKGSTSGMK
jgi:hypothetical protein